MPSGWRLAQIALNEQGFVIREAIKGGLHEAVVVRTYWCRFNGEERSRSQEPEEEEQTESCFVHTGPFVPFVLRK